MHGCTSSAGGAEPGGGSHRQDQPAGEQGLGSAAEALFVHVNSLRYRLRRLCEIGQIDLGSSEERFRLQFALKVLPSVRLEA